MVVETMTSSAPVVEKILAEIIAAMASQSPLTEWPQLMDELLLSLKDIGTCRGAVQVANLIFKPWRKQLPSHEIYNEVMQKNSVVFFELLSKLTDRICIDPISQNSEENLISIELLVQIFVSLNSFDFPEFIHFYQQKFMNDLHQLINYKFPANSLFETESSLDSLKNLKSGICECILLYVRVNEVDFIELPTFLHDLVQLLETSPINECAITVLTEFVVVERFKSIFEDPDCLMRLCQLGVINNSFLTGKCVFFIIVGDEVLFYEDQGEFIRQDMEGHDADTRRRLSADLFHGLLELFATEVTNILWTEIRTSLTLYKSDSRDNWKCKDLALFLLTSLSVKSDTFQKVEKDLNKLIPILEIYATDIIPDLECATDDEIHPLLKVGALKFLKVFSHQLDKQQILQVIPHVMRHLQSRSFCVYTWASYTLEHILAMQVNAAQVLTYEECGAFARTAIDYIFDIMFRTAGAINSITRPLKLAENEHLMKCIIY